MKQTKPNFLQKPVHGKYTVRLKLKEGGFGAVYLARDVNNKKKQYAIKFMPAQSLRYAEIQQKMYGMIAKQQYTHGFVKCFETGQFLGYRYILMELMGQDLEQIKKKATNNILSIKTVLMIGLQAADRLQALHKIGFVHRDVKPDNLGIGLKEKNKVIYLFDFGLAHKIGSGIPKQQQGKVMGTLGFMSCRAHQGKQQGPADDIQSLIYTLLFLAQGSLPWLKLKIKSPADFHKILLTKRSFVGLQSVKNKQIPQQLFDILNTVRGLKNNQKVDYLQIKYKLLDALKNIKQQNDFIFDWVGQTARSNSPRSPKKQSPVKKQVRRSPEKDELDSPLRKKQEKMQQDNQQVIQNEIYQVYKFIQDKPVVQKQKLNEKQSANKARKPSPKKLQQQQKKVNQVDKKVVQRPIRPASAVASNKQKPISAWDKILLFQQSNKFSGPNIVINKTAKHKI